MESQNSIGQSVGSVLTSIKTKGGEALEATARFLRWTIKPAVYIYSYFVGKSKNDATQSKEEGIELGLRAITFADENSGAVDKKTTSASDPGRAEAKTSANSNNNPVKQQSQEHRPEVTDEVSAASTRHVKSKPVDGADTELDRAISKLFTDVIEANANLPIVDADTRTDGVEILTKEEQLNKKRNEIKSHIHSPNGVKRRDAEWEFTREAGRLLRKEFSELLDRLPNVSVEDTRKVLKAYYQITMVLTEGLPDNDEAHAAIHKLEQHFYDTGQKYDFSLLRSAIGRSVAHELREKLGEDRYKRLVRRASRSHPNSHCLDAWQRTFYPIIRRGISYARSIHGHRGELISAKDMALILDSWDLFVSENKEDGILVSDAPIDLTNRIGLLREKLQHDARRIKFRTAKLPDELRTLDLNRVAQDFKQFELLQDTSTVEQQKQNPEFIELATRCEAHRALIAQGRAVLLDIQLNEGRRWDLESFIKLEGYASDTNHNQQMLKKLLELDRLRGPQVDLAQLDWLIAQNLNAQKHLNVAVEGAGPTGLTLAFTQFQEGANVSVFEKRSTECNQQQVVRLDPKWMDMLKFYLGEHFYDMFGQDGQPGKGIVRPDGFGEIASDRLENALNHRLNELMARKHEQTPQSSDQQEVGVERLAGYEMKAVEESKEGFTVQAQYNPEHAPSSLANGQKNSPADDQKPETMLSRPVDLVICAGGQNSKIRSKYMEDRVVTDSKSYAVGSWEGTKDQPIANDRLDTFPDYRGMLVFDQKFQQFFREQLKSQLDKIEGLNEHERFVLEKQFSEDSKNIIELETSTLGRAVRTRCLENKNQVSIGIELPEEFNQFCQNVQKQLAALPASEFDQNRVKRSEADQEAWPKQRAAKAQKAISKALLQTAAHSYDLDSSLGITEEKINDSSAAIFPVQQHRVRKNVVKKKSGSHKVVITAAGDAAASHHFMSSTGLTGARENVLHLQNYTKDVSRQENPKVDQKTQRLALDYLEMHQKGVRDFVIQQGKDFLGEPSVFKRLFER